MTRKTYIIILLLALITVAGTARSATTLEVGIPGQIAPGSNLPGIPEYIKYLYLFVLGFVGIAGFASIVFWGAVWAGSGVVDKKQQAISGIKSTLTGIGIALTAFIILYTINPDLTVIRAPNVGNVGIEYKAVMTPQEKTQQQTNKYCDQFTVYQNKLGCNTNKLCGWAESGSMCVSKQQATCSGYNTDQCMKDPHCQLLSNICVLKL